MIDTGQLVAVVQAAAVAVGAVGLAVLGVYVLLRAHGWVKKSVRTGAGSGGVASVARHSQEHHDSVAQDREVRAALRRMGKS